MLLDKFLFTQYTNTSLLEKASNKNELLEGYQKSFTKDHHNVDVATVVAVF